MNVKINVPSSWQRFTYDQEVAEVAGSTIGECLNHLVKQFPDIESELFDESGNLFQYLDIYVNGKSSYPEELAKPVKDGDVLYILREIGGG